VTFVLVYSNFGAAVGAAGIGARAAQTRRRLFEPISNSRIEYFVFYNRDVRRTTPLAVDAVARKTNIHNGDSDALTRFDVRLLADVHEFLLLLLLLHILVTYEYSRFEFVYRINKKQQQQQQQRIAIMVDDGQGATTGNSASGGDLSRVRGWDVFALVSYCGGFCFGLSVFDVSSEFVVVNILLSLDRWVGWHTVVSRIGAIDSGVH
jgi:hypothetical protein